MSEYTDRYVAFVDILGFRNLLADVAKGKMQFERLRDVLRAVHQQPDPVYAWIEEADFRSQTISDAVALSSALNPKGLKHLFDTINELATQLLRSGFFIRGAITKGKLYHDENVVFGEGLVRAYEFESKIARFPRIIVTSDVASDIENYSEQHHWIVYFRNALRQADDGPFYLHTLCELAKWVERGISWNPPSIVDYSTIDFMSQPVLEAGAQMRSAIQSQLDSSLDDPAVFEKIRWFAAYWNREIAAGIPGLEKICGVGVPPDPCQ